MQERGCWYLNQLILDAYPLNSGKRKSIVINASVNNSIEQENEKYIADKAKKTIGGSLAT